VVTLPGLGLDKRRLRRDGVWVDHQTTHRKGMGRRSRGDGVWDVRE
jgi:hypothetical protein